MEKSDNPVIDALLKRRSIRRYTSQTVDNSKIKELLRAGMYAPSAHNQQPWHFIVIDKREILDRIMEVHPYSKMLKGASIAIMVCGDQNHLESPGFWSTDCAAATQNILVAAHALGLGAVWLGVYPKEEIMQSMRVLFSLPQNILPFSLISLGYPDEVIAFPDRYRQERIRWNQW